MKISNIIFIIIILLIFTNSVYAASLQAKTYFGVEDVMIMPNGINNQIISNIPTIVLNNTNYVSGIKFMCGKNNPNGNLIVRVYNYHGAGVYELLESDNIPNNLCNDYGSEVFLTFNNEYKNDHSFSIGFYDSSISGNWYLFYLNTDSPLYKKSWLFLDAGTPQNPLDDIYDNIAEEIISDAYGVTYVGVKHIPIQVYGYSVIPTPTQPPNVQPCVNNCDVPMPSGTENGDPYNIVPSWTVNYSNFSNPEGNCPNCIGNESRNITGHIPVESGFSKLGISLGYCENGCTVNDFINILYDLSLFLFLLSYFLIGYKAYKNTTKFKLF